MNWNGLKVRDGRITARAFNRIVEALQSVALRPGVNYTISQTVGGTIIVPKGKGGATITISNVRSFQDATKHITQQLARLKEAIENASTTSTYAANILAIYDEVETTYPAEFKAMQIRHSNLYSIFKRTDVEMYI